MQSRPFSDDPYSDLPVDSRRRGSSGDPIWERGLGVLCAEAQADGVPCWELGRDCQVCWRAWQGEPVEEPAEE